MNTRPKIPANARNLNACVIGSSGSGKTRFWLTPQLLQAHSSYVVVDPKGGTLDQCGRFLQREKYRVRVFNSIDFSKSMHYNPLAYIKTESDVLKFVTALIANTKGDGKILGRHKGIIHYTVGQRKGLGISLGERAFVTEIRPQTNEVVIRNRAQACQTVLRANHLNFMAREDIQEEDHVFAKIRYNHKGAYCHVKRTGEDEITCTFEEAQHAITPGQAVVLYEDGYVLGGGTII